MLRLYSRKSISLPLSIIRFALMIGIYSMEFKLKLKQLEEKQS